MLALTRPSSAMLKTNHLVIPSLGPPPLPHTDIVTGTDITPMDPPVRRELQGVQFDHGHYVPLVVIGHLLHTSILGQPHPTLGAGQAGGGRRGRCEGV